jgi:dipeptidyl aminopeptidase/acylaminoacyl peptidase
MTTESDIATAPALTAAAIAGMCMPGEPAVSPDGRMVAFRVQTVTKAKKKKSNASAIWVAPVDGSRPARRWTPETSAAQQPRWSPNGRWLAFTSDREEEGTWQLFRMPAEGGEAERLTDRKGGVESFGWSPDGTRIAFTAVEESWCEDKKRREEEGDDGDVWGERLGFLRLRMLHLDSGRVETVTAADRHVTEFSWSPPGRELAVALARRPDLEAGPEAGVELVVLTSDGGDTRPVCHVPFGAGNLTWTADGGAILFTLWESGAIPSSMAAWLVAADGRSARRCLTMGIDGCVVRLLRAVDSPAILCAIAEGLTTRLYEIDPVSGHRSLVYSPSRGVPGEFALDAAGRVLAVVSGSGTEPPEVWCGDPARGLRRVSECNPALAGIAWAEQAPFTWTAPDGLKLDGLVLRPRNATGTPPGVMLVHGGPYGRWGDGFNVAPGNWAQWLALDSYAVFLPNPRGGMGHGHAFAATVAGEVGMADWLDVASGADAFVAAGHADRDRLGIGGWSQGGFMTAWAVSGGIPEGAERGWSADYTSWRATAADRFRTGIDGAGPTDWGTMASESDMPTFEAMLGGSRLGDGIGPHRHAVISPISYAGRVRTPLLILHGRNDERVPIGQATGFFHEIRRRGVPADLIVYPREPHGIREEAHVIDMLGRVRAWYGRWLRQR